jgi:HipA-like protein
MSDSLVVLLDDTTAGTLTRLRGGQLRFDYDDHYRLRPGVTGLSVSMPTQIRSHSDHVITPPVGRGSLPHERTSYALPPRL